MTTESDVHRQKLLQEMAAIERMERGRLCPFKNPKRAADANAPVYYKHQAWHAGKNHTCYVPADKASEVQEAIEGYQRFRKLAEDFAQLTIDQTREQLAMEDHSKKNRKSKKPASRKPKHSSKSPKPA